MANLIRLKQIESGSGLATSAQIGQDFSSSVTTILSQSLETTFSQSIINVITNNVNAVLPDGLVSSSAQIASILLPLNQFTASLDSVYATDFEVYTSQSNITIDVGEL
jgi:hypothetical protein